MWQDYVVTSVIWTFVLFTIPMVKQVFKEGVVLTPVTTVPTAVGNYILMVVWITFPEPMWISFFSSFSIATLWLLMAIGSRRNKRDKSMEVKKDGRRDVDLQQQLPPADP